PFLILFLILFLIPSHPVSSRLIPRCPVAVPPLIPPPPHPQPGHPPRDSPPVHEVRCNRVQGVSGRCIRDPPLHAVRNRSHPLQTPMIEAAPGAHRLAGTRVLVAGAGLAGLSAACALEADGAEVTVV